MLRAADNGRSTLNCHPPEPDTAIGGSTSQKFTGQVRDAESRLDYFGARYMPAPQGRFLSPDPLLNSGRPWVPQSWNRYAYAMNNPLRFVDPDGLYELDNTCDEEDESCNADFRRNADRLKAALERLKASLESFSDPVGRGRLERALETIGAEGDGNDIVVSFGPVLRQDGSPTGAAGGATIFGLPDGYGVCLVFDPARIRNDTDWSIAGAHEGNRAADFLDPRYAANPNSLSMFSLEYRAYRVSAHAAAALGESNFTLETSRNGRTVSRRIWNRSWGVVDIDRAITAYLTTDRDNPFEIVGGIKDPWE